jgi:hypothetical protein
MVSPGPTFAIPASFLMGVSGRRPTECSQIGSSRDDLFDDVGSFRRRKR